MKLLTYFTVGQLVKQKGSPDLIIIITSIDNDKFSGRVVVNENDVYACEVGELIEGNDPIGFQPIAKPLTFGKTKPKPKFQVGDFIRHDDTDDDTYWTAMVTSVSEETFGMVVLTTTSGHIYSGDEYRCEEYDEWELTEILVLPPIRKFRVGDRVSSNLIYGDNMLTVTEVSNDAIGTFTAVVVRNAMNPEQEGELYTDLIPSTFTPYTKI